MNNTTIVLLEKDDFILVGGQLVIRHPAFVNRGGFVAFYTYHCPNCQDTKTSWSAIGIVRGTVPFFQGRMPIPERYQMISRAKNIKRYPLLKSVRKDGLVTEWNGNVDKRVILDAICCKAGLNCGHVYRSIC